MKIALVTGGSRGIGLACALHLAQSCRVYIAARDPQALAQAAEQALKVGIDLPTISLDVSDLNAVQGACQRVAAKEGQIDILVHAAGTSAFSVIDAEGDPEQWHHVIQTNLNGAYYCARSVLPYIPAGGGRLILISSVLGLRGMRNSHAYAASKHGVIGLTKSLAQDLIERGVTVNTVCPGWVKTEMALASMAKIAAHYQIPADSFIEAEIQAVPIQRWIESDEIATLVAYLASEQAGAITGQAFEISGGL